jgi:hypothetical protein
MPTCTALLWNTKVPAGEDSFLISLNSRALASPRDAPGLRMSLPGLVQGGYGEWSGGAAIRPIIKWALFSCAPRQILKGADRPLSASHVRTSCQMRMNESGGVECQGSCVVWAVENAVRKPTSASG